MSLISELLALVAKRSNPLLVSIEGDWDRAGFSAGEQRDWLLASRAA